VNSEFDKLFRRNRHVSTNKQKQERTLVTPIIRVQYSISEVGVPCRMYDSGDGDDGQLVKHNIYQKGREK